MEVYSRTSFLQCLIFSKKITTKLIQELSVFNFDELQIKKIKKCVNRSKVEFTTTSSLFL